MSVIIKGMEMPKSCCDCKFVQKGSQEFCGLLLPDIKYSENWERKPTFCPLVDIPPHGRLIDADEAEKYAYDILEISELYRTPYEAAREMLKIYLDAPTILEAEKGE